MRKNTRVHFYVLGGMLSARTITEQIEEQLENLVFSDLTGEKTVVVVIGDKEENDPLEMLIRWKDTLTLDRFIVPEIIIDSNPVRIKHTAPGFLSKVFPIREEIYFSCGTKIFLVERNRGPPFYT